MQQYISNSTSKNFTEWPVSPEVYPRLSLLAPDLILSALRIVSKRLSVGIKTLSDLSLAVPAAAVSLTRTSSPCYSQFLELSISS